MATFTPRLTRPEAGNKYYIRKASGGYSNAIKGSPTDADCDVLSNCVGYAYGRFNEIGEYGYCKYLSPVNAENFMQYKGDCKTGTTAKLGACMVWRKGATLSNSDGAGHVAIVEQIISDTKIVTSESGYGSTTPFWTKTRSKGSDGNWGAGSGYTFLGFIYNPAVDDDANSANVTDTSTITDSELTVDGIWGQATTRRLQEIFGTTVDGIVSKQIAKYRDCNPGLGSGWDWQTAPVGGSELIRAMQKWAEMSNSKIDGKFGPETCKAFQTKLGTFVDGVVSKPSKMVKALQTWANEQ